MAGRIAVEAAGPALCCLGRAAWAHAKYVFRSEETCRRGTDVLRFQ